MLIITNLPPHIRPAHINHILSHLRVTDPAGGDEGIIRRVDPGVRLVQIYTVSRKRSKRQKLASKLRVLVEPTRYDAKSDTPFRSVEKPDSNQGGGHKPIAGPEEAEAEETHSVRDTTLLEAEVRGEEEEEDEMGLTGPHGEKDHVEPAVQGETVAYVHFTNEYHLWQAQELLENVTVDGRRIRCRQKYFDAAPLRRFWRDLRRTGKPWRG